MINKKRIIAAMLAAPAVLAFSAPAQAQVSGAIGTTDPMLVIARSKAYTASRQQIGTTYKAVFDQINVRRTSATNEMKPLIAPLDTDKNGELSDAEIAAAQAAKNPALDRIVAAERKANEDIQKLRTPISRAEIFVVQNLLRQYETAQLKVVTAKKIGVLLRADAFLYAPDAVDVSNALVTEIDTAAPTVPIAPAADWNPDQNSFKMWQALKEAEAQAIAYQQAVAQQQAAQGAQPAPAAGQPARPATGPARPAAQPKPAEPR